MGKKSKIGFLSAKQLDKMIEALVEVSCIGTEIESLRTEITGNNIREAKESLTYGKQFNKNALSKLNSIINYHSLIPEEGTRIGRLNEEQLTLADKAISILKAIPELMSDAMRTLLNGDSDKAISFIDSAEKHRQEAEKAIRGINSIHNRTLWENGGRTAYKVSRSLLEAGFVGRKEYDKFMENYLNH